MKMEILVNEGKIMTKNIVWCGILCIARQILLCYQLHDETRTDEMEYLYAPDMEVHNSHLFNMKCNLNLLIFTFPHYNLLLVY